MNWFQVTDTGLLPYRVQHSGPVSADKSVSQSQGPRTGKDQEKHQVRAVPEPRVLCRRFPTKSFGTIEAIEDQYQLSFLQSSTLRVSLPRSTKFCPSLYPHRSSTVPLPPGGTGERCLSPPTRGYRPRTVTDGESPTHCVTGVGPVVQTSGRKDKQGRLELNDLCHTTVPYSVLIESLSLWGTVWLPSLSSSTLKY